MQRRKSRREFKVEAIRLVKKRSVSVAQAARDLEPKGRIVVACPRRIAHCPGTLKPIKPPQGLNIRQAVPDD
jgi:transposase